MAIAYKFEEVRLTGKRKECSKPNNQAENYC